MEYSLHAPKSGILTELYRGHSRSMMKDLCPTKRSSKLVESWCYSKPNSTRLDLACRMVGPPLFLSTNRARLWKLMAHIL